MSIPQARVDARYGEKYAGHQPAFAKAGPNLLRWLNAKEDKTHLSTGTTAYTGRDGKTYAGDELWGYWYEIDGILCEVVAVGQRLVVISDVPPPSIFEAAA